MLEMRHLCTGDPPSPLLESKERCEAGGLAGGKDVLQGEKGEEEEGGAAYVLNSCTERCFALLLLRLPTCLSFLLSSSSPPCCVCVFLQKMLSLTPPFFFHFFLSLLLLKVDKTSEV